jgi:hypothetical protein
MQNGATDSVAPFFIIFFKNVGFLSHIQKRTYVSFNRVNLYKYPFIQIFYLDAIKMQPFL